MPRMKTETEIKLMEAADKILLLACQAQNALREGRTHDADKSLTKVVERLLTLPSIPDNLDRWRNRMN